MAKTKDVPNVYALPVALTAANAAQLIPIVEGEGSDADKLGKLASQVLTTLAEGGLLVSPAIVDQLTEMAAINDAADLVPLVEKATKHKDGGIVLSARLDPVWKASLQETAQASGLTLTELAQKVFDRVLAQNLFLALRVDPQLLYLDPKEVPAIKEILGIPAEEALTGGDLAEFVKRQELLIGAEG